jgi:hypothetical protein
MVTAKQVIKAINDPIRHNDLEARRRKLGLSRVALARILETDPATVFRRERGAPSGLWDYALRGIEAEAKMSKQARRSFTSGLDLQAFIPEQLAARGFPYTAEKMHAARQEHARTKRHPPRLPRANKLAPSRSRRTRSLTEAEIKAAADRAEAQSKLHR